MAFSDGTFLSWRLGLLWCMLMFIQRITFRSCTAFTVIVIHVHVDSQEVKNFKTANWSVRVINCVIVGLHCRHLEEQTNSEPQTVMKAGRRAVFDGDLYVSVKISVILGTNLEECFIKQKELRQLTTRFFMLDQKEAAHIVS